MNVEGVHHIAMICSDYEISKHFYTEVLGFKIKEETYKLDLQVPGGIQIATSKA